MTTETDFGVSIPVTAAAATLGGEAGAPEPLPHPHNEPVASKVTREQIKIFMELAPFKNVVWRFLAVTSK